MVRRGYVLPFAILPFANPWQYGNKAKAVTIPLGFSIQIMLYFGLQGKTAPPCGSPPQKVKRNFVRIQEETETVVPTQRKDIPERGPDVAGIEAPATVECIQTNDQSQANTHRNGGEHRKDRLNFWAHTLYRTDGI